MNAHVGNGWRITHLTDRVLEMEKDDYTYRRVTGRNGVVRIRAQEGMDRNLMIERGLKMANKCDGELAMRVAAQNLPTGKALAEYRLKTRAMARSNHTGEESFVIGAKRV